MVRYHIIVRGKVQGVGFRFFTQQKASLNGITGWVKNKSDCSVEIDAEGDKDSISSFIDAIKKGSPFSKIEEIKIKQLPPLKNNTSFKINY